MNKNSILKILPVKKDPIKPSILNPILPVHPFALILVGPPRAGKSNTLVSLIASEQFYYCGNEHDKDNASYFDEIYVFCPSARFDLTTKKVYNAMDNLIIIDDLDDLRNAHIFIQEIMKSQKEWDEVKEKRPPKKILFLFDDMVGMLLETGIDILITKYRHYNISILLCSQAYRKIPLTVRNCATGLIFFNLMNQKEVEKVYDEYGSNVPNFHEHIKVLNKKFQFCFYHLEDQKFYHNFERLLWSKDDYLT